jgi:hypothetical protein
MDLYNNRSIAESVTYSASRQVLEKGVKMPSVQDVFMNLAVCTTSKLLGPMITGMIPILQDMDELSTGRRAASLVLADAGLRMLTGKAALGALKPAPVAAAGAAALAGQYANANIPEMPKVAVDPATDRAGVKPERTPAQSAAVSRQLKAGRRMYSEPVVPEGSR